MPQSLFRAPRAVRTPLALAICLQSLLLLAALTGCGVSTAPIAGSVSAPPASSGSQPGTSSSPGQLQGRSLIGPAAIANAHIYLLAANTTGYGLQSISLLNPADPGVFTDSIGNYVVSDGNGSFSFRYHCTPGELVYILAQGGAPRGEGSNPALALFSVFGSCPATGDFSDVITTMNINQVSTVVGAYALSGYMNDASHVSSAGTPNALHGIANAFAAVGNLMDVQTGVAYQYTQGSGVVPQTTINTLANILIPCSNSYGDCAALFSAVKTVSGTAPSDTTQAALAIARNPSANIQALFAIAGTQPVQPALAAAPNDWTLGITYFAENLAGPYFPAVDGSGNLWVPGYANNTITEFDALGNVLSGQAGFSGGGLAQPFAIAIDPSGNAWVSSYGAVSPGTPTLSEFAANGSPVTSNGFSCGTACSFLAIDSSSNVWVSGAPQVAVVRGSGTALSSFSPNGAASGIAIDSQGRGWAIGSGRNLTRLTIPGGMTQFPEAVTTATGTESNAIAIDAADNIWVASPKGNAIGKFSNAGAALSPAAGYTGGGLHTPSGLAVDGDGRLWVANRDGNSISVFDNSGKPLSSATGYTAAGVSNPRGIVVDPSGNVWVTDFTGNAVTEFLGAATPAATPITPLNHGRRP